MICFIFRGEFEDIQETFARSVIEHADHIYHHLEWDPLLRSNHYLADIVGFFSLPPMWVSRPGSLATVVGFRASKGLKANFMRKEATLRLPPVITAFG